MILPFCLYRTKHKDLTRLIGSLGTAQVPLVLTSLAGYIRVYQ